MKHLRTLLVCLLAVIAFSTAGEAQSYMNVLHYGSSAFENGHSVCTAPGGHVIMAGYYEDSLTFGTTVLTATAGDGFVVKYNAAGVVQWAKRIAGAGTARCMAVKADNSGNVYLAGTYYGTASLDTFTVSSSGGSVDIFLAKLNSAGLPLWFKTFGSTLSADNVFGIALDNAANIYMTGETSGSTQFGNGVSLVSINHPVNGPSVDAFTAKINNSGVAQWARSGGSIGTDRSFAIDCDAAGNSYITGFYQNNATFSGGQLTASGPVQIFVASYTSTGTLQLLLQAGSTGYEAGYGIALDGMGSFYITGLHDGATLFDTITAMPNGSYDMFLAKYTTSGNIQWVRSTVSSQWEQGWSVDTDDKGNPYVAATVYFNGTSMFNEVHMTSIGSHDPVIVKYDKHGEFQWAVRGGTINYDEILEIAVADSGIVYGAGYVGGTSSSPINITFGTYSFNHKGANDLVFLKLRTDIVTGPINISNPCAGQPVSVPFTVNTITSMAPGNVYTAQISDASGRFANARTVGTLNSSALSGTINGVIPDSTATGSGYRIRVISSDSSRTGADNGTDFSIQGLPLATITSNGTNFCAGDSLALNASVAAGNTYQWKNGANAIVGATSPVYYAKATGTYSLVVTNQNGCSRTSPGLAVVKRSLPSAVITLTGNDSICSGTYATMQANLGTGLTYQWKKSVNNIVGATDSAYSTNKGGAYKCVVTSQYGCSRTSNKITITILAAPTAVITTQDTTTICAGDSVVMQANTGAGLSYQWRKYSNNISGATASSYTATSTGNYKVIVTNANGCTKTSNAILVTVNCRMGYESPVTSAISAYPNPADEFIVITAARNKNATITLSDAIGKVIKTIDLQAAENTSEYILDVADVKPGVYFLSVQAPDEKGVYRIVIQ